MNHKTKPGEDKVIAFPERKTIRTQAAEWIARLEVNEPGKKDLAAFRDWVNKDQAHYEEFERLNNLWGDLNLLTQITMPAERLDEECKGYKEKKTGVAGWLYGRLTSRYQLLASAAVIALLVVTVTNVDWPLPHAESYKTAIGEQQTILLPDESIVKLNTNSRLEVDYSSEHRSIYLLQGEAHFDVRKESQRPFEVYAGAGLVRAVGTAFSVRIKQAEVEVLVDEGIVEIDPVTPFKDEPEGKPGSSRFADAESQAPPQPTRLKAGSQATYEREQPQAIKLTHSVEIERKLAWREGLLEFRRDPLAKVVEEVSRYTATKIVIADEKAGRQIVGGRFKVGDTQVLLEALESGFGIKVDRVDNDTIYLSYAEE